MKSLSIKVKLTILVISGLLISTIANVALSISQSSDSLLKSEFAKLETAKLSKKVEIEKYFGYLSGLLTSLASQEGTKDAFNAFENGFYKLNEELNLDVLDIENKLKADLDVNYLNSVNYDVPNSEQRKPTSNYIPLDVNGKIAQYIFITDNSEKLGEKNNLIFNPKYNSTYMTAHKKYHESFDKILKSYSLYDIFMVDLQGNLIYTDFKEKDFATNLLKGVYSNTGIARVYNKALSIKEGEIAFDDFTSYEPSYNSSASFIGTPIVMEGITKGVLIFQMPVDEINDIMQFSGNFKDAGLGESGEVYLVGSDNMMRSNSRFQKDLQDKTVQALGTTIGVWEINTKSTQAALNGQSGKWIIPDYRGINVLSAYDSVNIFDQTKWSIVAEIDEEEATASISVLKYSIILISLVILVLVIFVNIYFMNKSLIKPLKTFEAGLLGFFRYLNREEKEVSRISINTADEIGAMAKVVNENIDITKNDIEDDRRFIDNTVEVLKDLEQGDFSKRIKVDVNNPSLKNLRDVFNAMGDNLEQNTKNVLNILNQYTAYNFMNKVDTANVKNHLLELSSGVNKMGNSIIEMLSQEKKVGLDIQSSSKILLNNVNTLNEVSTKPASRACSRVRSI